MAQRWVAAYRTLDEAQMAVEELVNSGVSRDRISLLAGDKDKRYQGKIREFDPSTLTSDDDVKPAQGAGFGAVVGTLVGLGALLLPGIGPVIAAGPAVAALVAGIGAAGGAVTGGVVAGLVNFGMDETAATAYADLIRQGGTMVVVDALDAEVDKVEDILNRHRPMERRDDSTIREAREGMGSREPAMANHGVREFDEVVEDMPRSAIDADPGYARYVDRYRADYNTRYASMGLPFERYSPAYQFGYMLGTDPRYEGQHWDDVEATARYDWEQNYREHGAWEQFKDAIRHAWDSVRGRA